MTMKIQRASHYLVFRPLNILKAFWTLEEQETKEAEEETLPTQQTSQTAGSTSKRKRTTSPASRKRKPYSGTVSSPNPDIRLKNPLNSRFYCCLRVIAIGSPVGTKTSPGSLSKLATVLPVGEIPSTASYIYVNVLPRMRVWFNFVIHEFGKRGDLKSALIAFQELEKSTIGPDMYSYRDIIDACGLCGQPVRARNIFKELINQKISPNVFLYNSLMNVNAGDLNYVLQIYKHMQTSGVTPDVTTYNILLKACCIVGKVDSAEFFYKEVLNRAAAGNLKLDLITYSTMIQVFGEAKMWEKAMEVKMDMIAAGVTPDIVTWTTLIGACANAGLVEQAIQFFDEMVLSGCEPNTQCCNNLLHACVESCQYARAFQLFHTWKKNGFYETSAQRHKEHIPLAEPEVTLDAEKSKSENLNHEIQASIPSFDTHPFRMSQFKPTIVTYNILMKSCGTSPHHAKALMKEMEILGLLPNHISWSILIDAYGNLGDLRGVLQLKGQ
eukprot:Gb_13517 [translate_table: standard]